MRYTTNVQRFLLILKFTKISVVLPILVYNSVNIYNYFNMFTPLGKFTPGVEMMPTGWMINSDLLSSPCFLF